MISTSLLLGSLVSYTLLIVGLALWGERQATNPQSLISRILQNRWFYTLGLCAYCSAWCYYGSISIAATSGIYYIPIFLGPILACFLFTPIWERLILIKQRYHINSLTDFISVRYGNTQCLAAVVTLVVALFVVAYIALQIKALVTHFNILVDNPGPITQAPSLATASLLILVLSLLTIVVSLRHIDPTERRPGMMLAVALAGSMKIFTMLLLGVYVTFVAFDGFGDILQQAFTSHADKIAHLQALPSWASWINYTLLSLVAFFCLPHVFHVAVLENRDVKHVKHAAKYLPWYFGGVALFVFPLASAGLIFGLPLTQADVYLPLIVSALDQPALALLAYLGGYSASLSIIVVGSMALAIMISNHWLLPLLNKFNVYNLQHKLLSCRWALVVAILASSYAFAYGPSIKYDLSHFGLLAFVAILQSAPALLGGLFWSRGTSQGIVIGISLGLGMWAYSLLVPMLFDVSQHAGAWYALDVWYVLFNSPVYYLTIQQPDPIFIAVGSGVVLNLCGYILGSLIFTNKHQYQHSSLEFYEAIERQAQHPSIAQYPDTLHLSYIKHQVCNLFRLFMPAHQAEQLMQHCLEQARLKQRLTCSIPELALLKSHVTRCLAGAIGRTNAHELISQHPLITAQDQTELESFYSELLQQLNLTPTELRQQIDQQRRQEHLILQHNRHQSATIDALQHEVDQRKHMEQQLQDLNDQLEEKVCQRTSELEATNNYLNKTLQQLKLTQHQLVESEKMAALGNLVAGISHEINTPIGIGVTAASHLSSEIDKLSHEFQQGTLARSQLTHFTDTATESCNLIMSNLNRASELIKSFKRVAVDQSQEIIRTFSLRNYLDEIILSLKPQLKQTLHHIVIHCDEHLEVAIDPGALSQIITNLIMNSIIHAFGPAEAGIIEIRVQIQQDDIFLTYRDNGKGIPSELLESIFEPFVTTRRNQGGSGLGTHIIYNLVTQRLKGRIKCESPLGEGAIFHMRFPRHQLAQDTNTSQVPS